MTTRTNNDDEEVPRSLGLLAVSAATAAVTVLLAFRMRSAMESFRGLFGDFGVKPSWAATLVMDFSRVWWVFAIASVAVLLWILGVSRPKRVEHVRMKLTLRLLIGFIVLAYAFAAIALYAPIFELGAVV